MSRAGGGWVRARARRRLGSELASLHAAGCRTIVLVPDDAVIRAADGYPNRRREARYDIGTAARQQTLGVLRELTAIGSRAGT